MSVKNSQHIATKIFWQCSRTNYYYFGMDGRYITPSSNSWRIITHHWVEWRLENTSTGCNQTMWWIGSRDVSFRQHYIIKSREEFKRVEQRLENMSTGCNQIMWWIGNRDVSFRQHYIIKSREEFKQPNVGSLVGCNLDKGLN